MNEAHALSSGSQISASQWVESFQIFLKYAQTLPFRLRERLFLFAEELFDEDFSQRAHQINTGLNEAGFDAFGYDPEVGKYALAFASLLYRYYFRTEVYGLSHLPKGRAMIVSNHSGQLPIDGLLLGTSLALEASPPRLARAMVERWSAVLPFISVFFPRSGQVIGSPENARRLLEHEETLVVFPEGARGISKTFWQRYQLCPFSQGFMRLALETQTPIIPAAVIGTEEQYVSVSNMKRIARLFGMPSFPFLPQLFLGMPLPLPTKVRIWFGEPIEFEGHHDAEESIILNYVSRVQDTVQKMVHDGLCKRQHVFW